MKYYYTSRFPVRRSVFSMAPYITAELAPAFGSSKVETISIPVDNDSVSPFTTVPLPRSEQVPAFVHQVGKNLPTPGEQARGQGSELVQSLSRSGVKKSRLLLLLLLALCLSLFHGPAISYDYGSDNPLSPFVKGELKGDVTFGKGDGVELISSDASGVVLELRVGDLVVESKEFDNRDYHLISYDGCAFTAEVGKPRLPVSQVFLGVPPSASISINMVDSQFSDLAGYTPLPVPKKVHRTSNPPQPPFSKGGIKGGFSKGGGRRSDGIDMLVDEFAIDREFYGRNAFYPSGNAALVYEGYVRRQRVAVIELRPVQYNPITRLLRKYSRLVVRVSFSSGVSAPPGTLKSLKSLESLNVERETLNVDKEFEGLYQGLLLNYDDAREWRKARSIAARAPARVSAEVDSEAFKLFVARHGIYRLDDAMLRGAGIDLSQVDPRTIKIQIRGSQVPIYVYGEADGRFDAEDYVEFFGAKPDSIYTRWNVYRLTWGGAKGMRMVQRSGSPQARTAREVTFFKSVERFEEDHLHHKLQNVRADPDDPEAWFESRDHWFWDGIENGSAKNEVTIQFPVYDLAQTLVRHDFKIELVGCTNYEHNIMISLNGYRVGEEAKWDSQDIYSFDGQIPANALREGMNELRLARIGTNPADGENLDSYPYQIYLNWFEAGYVRKLLAVNDSLEFSAPEPKDLNAEEVNRYTIAGFLDSEIEVFQITDSNAVSKLKDVVVNRYELDQDERDRIRRLKTQDSRLETGNELVTRYPLPVTGFTVTFEDQGGRSSRYISVTSASVLKPERIEKDVSSNLKDVSNRADYIVISHPMFTDAAEGLAEWRRGERGGGFRVQVVDVTDIYDEFGFGMVSPKAIKDFLKFAYHNWAEPAPSYVLILADATYDFLGINEEFYEEPPELTGFIPSFYMWTTFGQTAVDHWYSTIDGDDGFPDIYLGRIPVEDISQAEVVLEKIIANESGLVNGAWRKQIISVADDDTYAAGDEMFQIGLEEIWQDYTPLGYDTEKIYLKDIAQQVEQDPQETRRPAEIVEEKIIDAFGNGAVIAQYSGHGGRHVWAHEIIFSITDIDSMKETEIYPFLLVLSCYNGYFDLPGELSMAEGLLRADGRGIVAMLSATRLTYGTGNLALNRLLFDGIFKDKLLRIGQVTAISKTKLLMEEGMSWLGQMQEYTLFGDPASRLNIPDYEVHPQLSNATVAPGGILELRAGQMVTSVGGQVPAYAGSGFDGQVTATVSFPDGRESSKVVTVARGSYPAVSFDIPADMVGGQGRLKLYGENAVETVVGGVEFSVSDPSLVNVNHEFIGNTLQFYVEVNDDAGARTGIKSVNFRWSSPENRTGTDSSMVFDQQKNVYKLAQAIPLSLRGGNLIYYITVEDLDGNSYAAERQTISLPSRPNLTIYRAQDSGLKTQGSEASISYGYSTQLEKWGVNVQLENSGTEKVAGSFQIMAFASDPDKDDDMVVDDGVQTLGQAKVDPQDWNDEGMASAFIPLSLSIGSHTVSVWIDPEFSAGNPENIFGAVEEGNEIDNISFRVLDITHILLEPGQEGATRSLDDVLHFSAPAGAVDSNEVIAIEPVQDVQEPLNQPAVSFVPLSEGQRGGYYIRAKSIEQRAKSIEQGEEKPYALSSKLFAAPVSLQMKFDLASFREDVKNEIGLADLSEDQLETEQKRVLEQALKERTSDIAVYLWHEPARKWSYMPSAPVLDEDGNILRRVHNTVPVSSNAGTGSIERNSIEADNDVTPAGEWAVFFTETNRYQLYFRGISETVGARHASPLQKLSDKTGSVGQLYHDDGITGGGTEIRFVVERAASPFQFGDVLKFTTTESLGQDGFRSILINRVERDNVGDGIVREISIDEDADTPIDEWVILFLDPEHFHLQGYRTGVVEKNNEPYIGTVGEEFHDPVTGFRSTLAPGARVFTTGDKFKFTTGEVGMVQATSESSGIFSLMLNRDDRPPDIQMDVGDQNFADGDVVSSEPSIHALISDDNGVDTLTHGLDIRISRDGADSEPAAEDDYVFHWDVASNQVPVNYWPGKLDPGEYEVRFQAFDFNGNSGTESIRFVVKREFELAKGSLMNYPNPFERETDVTFHLTSLADDAIVKIYTVSGRLIRTLEQHHAVNFVVINWDGRDEDGEEVANGVYYYKVRLKREGRKDIVEIGKMMKLK